MRQTDMLTGCEEKTESQKDYIMKFKKSMKGESITSLALTEPKECQHLIIGLSNGEIFTLRESPHVVGQEFRQALEGIIS
jgi:hypothetical protein